MSLDELAARPSIRRLLRNDARVIDAIVHQIAEFGWEGLSIKAVAHRADLSEQAVKDRHKDRRGLAVAAWRTTVGPATIDAFAEILRAFDLDGDMLARAPSAGPWHAVTQPSVAVRSAFELLVIAQFIPDLHTAVTDTLGAQVRLWCSPRTTPAERRRATRRAFTIMRALGLGLLAPILPIDDHDLRQADDDMLSMFRSDGEASQLPDLFLAPFLSERYDDDPTIEALLRTTLDQVARKGFHDTSIHSITDTVGVPKAFALTRYRSKLGLFLEASRIQRQASLAANVAMQRRLHERYDVVTVAAAFTRAALRPGMEAGRALNLEQLRLSCRQAPLRESLEDRLERETHKLAIHIPLPEARHGTLTSMTMAEGIALLPTLLPDAWSLPWDVAWRPLMTRTPPTS